MHHVLAMKCDVAQNVWAECVPSVVQMTHNTEYHRLVRETPHHIPVFGRMPDLLIAIIMGILHGFPLTTA